MQVNYLDIVLLLPLLWGIFIGFKKGLVIEVATLVGIGLGIYGSIQFSDLMAAWLSNYVDWSSKLVRITSFILTFLLIVVVIHLIGRALEKVIKLAALGLVNRVAGSVFGLLKYTLLVTLLVYFMNNLNERYPFLSKETREDSMLYEPFSKVIPWAYPGISDFAGKEFQE